MTVEKGFNNPSGRLLEKILTLKILNLSNLPEGSVLSSSCINHESEFYSFAKKRPGQVLLQWLRIGRFVGFDIFQPSVFLFDFIDDYKYTASDYISAKIQHLSRYAKMIGRI